MRYTVTMKRSVNIQFFAFSCIVFFLLIGCEKQKAQLSNNHEANLSLTAHEAVAFEPMTPQWPETEKKICVIFGYGFNDKDFYEDTIALLQKHFGLSAEGGLVWPILYPDDVKGRISSLADQLDDQELKGIIILGAPENTHYMLAKLQDSWDGKLPYPVFSFFPQDDMLGMEATCDLVLEYERSPIEEASGLDFEQKIDADTEELLLRAVRYMAELPAPLPSDSDLHTHVQQIAGSTKNVRRYTDNETGLQSINHFVMEQDGSI